MRAKISLSRHCGTAFRATLGYNVLRVRSQNTLTGLAARLSVVCLQCSDRRARDLQELVKPPELQPLIQTSEPAVDVGFV